jgi:hypothetical protein
MDTAVFSAWNEIVSNGCVFWDGPARSFFFNPERCLHVSRWIEGEDPFPDLRLETEYRTGNTTSLISVPNREHNIMDLGTEKETYVVTVPDLGSRDRDVVLVRRTISSGKPRGVGNLERGGDGVGEVSSRASWGQGGQDRITSKEVSK